MFRISGNSSYLKKKSLFPDVLHNLEYVQIPVIEYDDCERRIVTPTLNPPVDRRTQFCASGIEGYGNCQVSITTRPTNLLTIKITGVTQKPFRKKLRIIFLHKQTNSANCGTSALPNKLAGKERGYVSGEK